jgi:molybdate transport system substrate-binding protein
VSRLAAAAGLAVVCALSGPPAAAGDDVRVLAASSLTEAFQEIGRAYERAHPGARVELSFAGSQVLRAQIEQGAPADVFASADAEQAEALLRQGLIGPPAVFARNSVLVAAPPAGTVRTLPDLARPGVKVVMAGPEVPAGRYAERVLEKLGATGAYGPDFAARVRANVVSRETNVRVVLSKVLLGEADAGFVYATDAASAGDKVRRLDLPACCTVAAAYPIAVVTRPGASPGAAAFVELVTGTAGQAILARHGFQP